MIKMAELMAALKRGYDPIAGVESRRPAEERRRDFQVLLEMHEPFWSVCPICRDAIKASAAQPGSTGPRPPELIRIFGRGFRPEPKQWRVLLGAWLNKWTEQGIELDIAGTLMEIGPAPADEFEEFVELVPRQHRECPGQLVEDLIARDRAQGHDMVFLAIWSLDDSPAMRALLGKS